MSAVGDVSSTNLSYINCGPNCQCASCSSAKAQAVNTDDRNKINRSTANAIAGEPLSNEQITQIQKLAARDLEVRQHEQAHLAASGGLAKSGASYSLQKGPDGKSYAIGGEVSIDTSAGKTPEETLRKARIIQAAALAPADPSDQDRQVAAAAQAMEMQAQSEIAQRSPQQQKLAQHYTNNALPRSGFETSV